MIVHRIGIRMKAVHVVDVMGMGMALALVMVGVDVMVTASTIVYVAAEIAASIAINGVAMGIKGAFMRRHGMSDRGIWGLSRRWRIGSAWGSWTYGGPLVRKL